MKIPRMEGREHCNHRQVHQRQNNEQSLLLEIPSGSIELNGNLESPENPIGIVLLAYSSGSSRYSPRNRYIARKFRESKIATLLFDLLTYEEEQIDRQTLHLRSDINLLSRRLVDATNWIIDYNNTSAGFGKQTQIKSKKKGRIA